MIKQENADVIVIGGGLGGCMAALAVAKMGYQVIMTEETDWLGGQFTSQGVPPDEHRWIESFGCTSTYREFRNRVRQYYRDNYPLTKEAKENDLLNPGNGWVSRLAHEPKVALNVISDMLAPFINSGKIKVLYNYKPIEATKDGDTVQAITVVHVNELSKIELSGHYYLDATECGDVLPIAGVEYVTGAESRSITGEPHALEESNLKDMQSFTYVFAKSKWLLEMEDFSLY